MNPPQEAPEVGATNLRVDVPSHAATASGASPQAVADRFRVFWFNRACNLPDGKTVPGPEKARVVVP